MTHHMEMLGEFYPEGGQRCLFIICLPRPCQLLLLNEKEETARLWALTAVQADTRAYADARVHRNDRVYSDTDELQTGEQARTVGIDTYEGRRDFYAALHSTDLSFI